MYKNTQNLEKTLRERDRERERERGGGGGAGYGLKYSAKFFSSSMALS